jgi:hypothetical protein
MGKTIIKKALNRFFRGIYNNQLKPHMHARLGHTLGFNLQRRWNDYHKQCQKAYGNSNTLTKNHASCAHQLHQNGIAVLAKLDCTALSKEIDSRFKSLDDGKSCLSIKLPRDSKTAELAPQIFNILREISPLIESYFSSYFQPYFITIERNQPSPTTVDTSFGWHIDDNPRQIMKIFVYLNDVYRDNGAFRGFIYKHSYKILKNGFVSYSEKTRIANQIIVNNYQANKKNSLDFFEGDAGTVLMFDNNIVHKGTAPIRDERQFIQIEIYPSLKKITEQQVVDALIKPILRDYPTDPYYNDMND